VDSKPAAAPVVPPPAPVAPAPIVSAPVAAAPPASTVSAQELAQLVARGDELLATGDIAAARLFYQRAAEQGSALAATAVGQTYDPIYLEQARVRGVRGDPKLAAEWYRKAAAAGDPQADIRLKRLLARTGG
jgi:TPR repeat protein